MTWLFGTTHTRLAIHNLTNQAITNIDVERVDSYDFDRGLCPKAAFQGKKIPAGYLLDERLEVVNKASNCPFLMKLTFQDGSLDSFHLRQKAALGDSADFWCASAKHDISMNAQKSLQKVTVTITNKRR